MIRIVVCGTRAARLQPSSATPGLYMSLPATLEFALGVCTRSGSDQEPGLNKVSARSPGLDHIRIIWPRYTARKKHTRIAHSPGGLAYQRKCRVATTYVGTSTLAYLSHGTVLMIRPEIVCAV